MKKFFSLVCMAVLLLCTACDSSLTLVENSADVSRAVVSGSNGTVTVSDMSNGNMKVTYNAGSQKNFARLYVSEGNGMGLVLANADMQYSNGVYTYTLNHPTFNSGAKVYFCVLVNDGGEKCVPQGNLADASSWASVSYGDNSTGGGSSSDIVSGGKYKITAKCSGKAVDVSDVSTNPSANVHQWDYVGGENQHWILDVTNDGYYTITAAHSGLCLDVQDWSTAAGGNVLQWHNNQQANQKWKFEKLDDGYYKITNQHSGKVLDVSGASVDNGANIQQWDWNGSDAQRWSVTLVEQNEVPVLPPIDPPSSGLFVDSNMTYGTWSQLESGVVADFAVGEWEGVSFGVDNGVATITVGDGYWHGATLGQLPAQVSSSSYYDFSRVAYINFWVKSSNISADAIQVIVQNTDSANVINSVPLTNYGVSNISNWTQVSVPVNSIQGQRIKTALAFSVGNNVGTSVQFKNIAFVDAYGNNVDVTGPVVWPITGAQEIKNRLNLAWSDEFNGSSTTPDASNWVYDTYDFVGWGWGNNELQTYTDSRNNSYVDNGTLKIRAVKDGNGNWTSGRLKTMNKRDFTYGFIEFRAKVADGVGMWPALWMLPTDTAYGTWPASGEIDVMEFSRNIWGTTVYGTLHCSAGYGGSPIHTAGRNMPTAGDEWHTYAVYWTPDSITWYYDDTLMSSYNNPHTGTAAWPYDQRFHIIMNVAVGGNLGGAVASNLTSDYMEIDYVRVYQ